MKIQLTILAAALAFSTGAYAASTSGTATAIVADGLSISQQTPINFGTIIPGGAAGTVNTAGDTTGPIAVTTHGNPGVFVVTGMPNRTVNMSTAANFPVTLTSGAHSMNGSLRFEFASYQLNAAGTTNVRIGGYLGVAANQPSGTYTGTYPATVNY